MCLYYIIIIIIQTIFRYLFLYFLLKKQTYTYSVITSPWYYLIYIIVKIELKFFSRYTQLYIAIKRGIKYYYFKCWYFTSASGWLFTHSYTDIIKSYQFHNSILYEKKINIYVLFHKKYSRECSISTGLNYIVTRFFI